MTTEWCRTTGPDCNCTWEESTERFCCSSVAPYALRACALCGCVYQHFMDLTTLAIFHLSYPSLTLSYIITRVAPHCVNTLSSHFIFTTLLEYIILCSHLWSQSQKAEHVRSVSANGSSGLHSTLERGLSVRVRPCRVL